MSGGKGMAARPPSSGRKQVTIRVYTGSPASPASSPQDLRPGQDETTGFLEDIEAAAAASPPVPEPGTPGGGGGTRRPWKCGDLWWLLLLPALVLMLLFAREWVSGGSGTTAMISRAGFRLGRDRAPVPEVPADDSGSGVGKAEGFGDLGTEPADAELAAEEAAAREAALRQGAEPGAGGPPADELPAIQPAAAADGEATADEGSGDVTAGDGDSDEAAGGGGASEDASPEGMGAPGAAEEAATGSDAASGAAVPEATGGEPDPEASAEDSSAQDGPAAGGDDVEAAEPRPAASSEGGKDPAQAADGSKRRSGARVVVMPTQWCQAMEPADDAECMATGAVSDKCKKAFRGTYMHSYLSPFLRIAPLMAEFGLPNYAVNSEIGPHRWRKPHDGSQWDREMAAADIIVLEEHDAKGIMKAWPNKTVVALQTNAAAAMMLCSSRGGCSHNLLQDTRVARFVQHTALRPLQLNNAQRYKTMPHYHLMQQVHVDKIPEAEHDWGPAPGEPAFTDEMLAKVRTLSPMFWRWRYPMTCHGQPEYVQLMAPSLDAPPHEPPAFLPPMAERPIDICFSGSVAPPEWRQTPQQAVQNSLYAAHRGALLDELEAIKQRNPGWRVEVASHISYPQFVKLLRTTKIFISPLGHGEYSGKDYEAVISRAVLVKPLARHLVSYPNIYAVNKTCVDVAMDFSNLEATLQGLLSDAPRMQQLADAAWSRLVEYSDPRRVAADVADMLHEVVEEQGL